MALPQKSFRQWTETEWSQALFEHYFAADETDAPVTRLVVNGRGLAQATNCGPENSEDVERSFIAVVRRPPDRLNACFRSASFVWAPLGATPGAVLFLLFTCYVASGNETVISDHDFRHRVAKILGHRLGTTYPLEGLAALWKKFQHWLIEARAAGKACRELVLPSPDWRTRIGYSIRLSFPQRRDQSILESILADAGFPPEAPIPELLQLLRRNRDRFSDTFAQVYEEFRAAFLRGGDDFSQSPLLDAVREAISRPRSNSSKRGMCPAMRLIGELNDEHRLTLMLLSDRAVLPTRSGKLLTFASDYSIGEHDLVLAFKTPDNEGADSAVEFFLAGELAEMLPGFASSPLQRAVADGVLLFRRGSFGIVEWVPNLSEDGDVRILVRRHLRQCFESALASVVKVPPCSVDSVYHDWCEFDGIGAAALRLIQWSSRSELDHVCSLQPCARTSRISLVGGIATGEAQTFFGHTSVLPAVRAHGSVATVTLARNGDLAHAKRQLRKADAGVFKIDLSSDEPPLDGEFVIEAAVCEGDGRILRKGVRFRALVDNYRYIAPARRGKWLSESAHADMSPYDGNAVFAGALSARFGTKQGGKCSRSQTALGSCRYDNSRLAALTEICAAAAARRCGFPPTELIELFVSVLGLQQQRAFATLTVRAWVEAGLLDEAVDVAWCARRYFARRPRLVVGFEADQPFARVVGLAPAMLINRFRTRAVALGGRVSQCPSWSPWVTGPWEVRGLESAQLSLLANELELGGVASAPTPSALVPRIENLEKSLTDEPLNYETFRVWNWERHRFVEPGQSGSESVLIEWRRRGRRDRPDFYVVRTGENVIFRSYSRNWALLMAARAARVRPYLRVPGGVLVSEGYPWVHLPTSVGRFGFAIGAGASGPVVDENNNVRYTYALGDESFAADILARLGIDNPSDEYVMPHWLDRLATARTHTEPLVPFLVGRRPFRRVPASLRHLMMAHCIRSKRRLS